MENALIDQPAATLPDAETRRPTPPTPRPAAKFDLRWVVMIGILLGASGLIRYGRDLQFQAIEDQSKIAPFPLKDLPTVLGGWRMVEGAETVLDPQIARIAGSSDHVVRTYENAETGEKASVLVLYGLAPLVWGHTPEICYLATGYKTVADPRDISIALAEPAAAVPFRQAVYGLFQGGGSSYHDVYYSFRNAGEWTPDMGMHWKRFRSHPGMFKIQIERQVKDARTIDKSCHDLLAALVTEIETRLKAGPSAVAPAVASAE
ncbi:exosortase-associated EpsI family protein [Paludisphaera soli]|uniref:exosortase-associated EpsI family protein n=1 Tax=Paludisphaera soli TaxID=2712865 RepID=UPI0013EA57CF|nr:exosortase-associated EpsI family protein [Paludisphaera soli]